MAGRVVTGVERNDEERTRGVNRESVTCGNKKDDMVTPRSPLRDNEGMEERRLQMVRGAGWRLAPRKGRFG
jgi:hypothetical protein